VGGKRWACAIERCECCGLSGTLVDSATAHQVSTRDVWWYRGYHRKGHDTPWQGSARFFSKLTVVSGMAMYRTRNAYEKVNHNHKGTGS
jgi:hypothetical protein